MDSGQLVFLALAVGAALGASALFIGLILAGAAWLVPDQRQLRQVAAGSGAGYGVVLLGALLLLLPDTPLVGMRAVFAWVLIGMFLTAAGAAAWLVRALAAGYVAAQETARQEGRDKALERQIRALVREQRALNRRQQEP